LQRLLSLKQIFYKHKVHTQSDCILKTEFVWNTLKLIHISSSAEAITMTVLFFFKMVDTHEAVTPPYEHKMFDTSVCEEHSSEQKPKQQNTTQTAN
jgi:hypothetical protein